MAQIQLPKIIILVTKQALQPQTIPPSLLQVKTVHSSASQAFISLTLQTTPSLYPSREYLIVMVRTLLLAKHPLQTYRFHIISLSLQHHTPTVKQFLSHPYTQC